MKEADALAGEEDKPDQETPTEEISEPKKVSVRERDSVLIYMFKDVSLSL